MYTLESTQSQLDRLQLDFARESGYNREGRLREVLLQEQLNAAHTLTVRHSLFSVSFILLTCGAGT
jgi:hypothetical protein